jgi:ATP-dependent Clp protease adaptor protein ClpS
MLWATNWPHPTPGVPKPDDGLFSPLSPWLSRWGARGWTRPNGRHYIGSVDIAVLSPMKDIITKPRIKTRSKTQRPRLHKVILVNDDYTPREFVVRILKAEFRMSEDQAYRVMITAHRRGVCVVAVYTRDVAETKAMRASEAGRAKGYPLQFTTEPEE